MYTVDYAKGAQARLYYFFMMADGDVSSAKRARFDQICEEMGIDDYSRDQIIWRCWKPYDKQKISHWEHIREKILQTVRKGEGGFLSSGDLFKRNDVRISVIWTLINLGYADGEYSKAERRIVAMLTDRWGLAQSVTADLTDTAEALAALSRQKEWVKTTSKPYDVIKDTVEELDRNIQMMFDNIKALISEAEIAETEGR